MFVNIVLSALIALVTFWGIGIMGPLPVFRVKRAVPLYTDAAITAYNRAATEYVQKQQAGTLTADAVAPVPPAPSQPLIYLGLNRGNLLWTVGVSLAAALVGTFGLMAMAEKARESPWLREFFMLRRRSHDRISAHESPNGTPSERTRVLTP
jgi:hypothetical protein